MIQTSFTKVKIHEIIQNQIPKYIDAENPLFGEFLKQYYISQEFQGAPIDIADNLVDYKNLDMMTNESLTGFTSLTSYTDGAQKEIFVESTKGWPNQYGLLKIDDEIITYTGIGTTSFIGCARAFSGIENNSKTNSPEYLTFTNSGVGTHAVDSRVTNLSNIFLKTFLKKIKKQILPGFAERNLNDRLNQSTFIKQAKDFYKSKGTEEAFKILFAALYGENVEMVQPSKFLVKPSDAEYVVNDVLICDLVSGDPLKITGQSLVQETTPLQTSGSIYAVEKSVIMGKEFYKISISRGTTIGKFQQVGKTFVTDSSPVGSTIVNVDSTIGFGATGTFNFEDRIISYTGKNYTQFTGISSLTSPCGIGSTVTSGIVATSYEDGDLNRPVTFNVLNLLKTFEGNAINQQRDAVINVKTLGEPREDLKYSTWLYNTTATYSVSGFALIGQNAYNFDLGTEHKLYVGDNIQIIGDDGTIFDGSITFTYDTLPKRVSVSSPTLSFNVKYRIRRKLKLSADGHTADIQNTYTDGDATYVACNSFPHWDINPQKRTRSFDNVGINTTTVEISISEHNFHDGDLVVYTSSGINTLTNLNENEAYYIKKIDANTVKLSYTAENVRRGQFLTAFGGSDISGVSTHFLTPFAVSGSTLGAQKLLKRFGTPDFAEEKVKTVQGGVGLFANGVQAYSYKSSDVVYFGPLQSVEVLNTGSDYDVINPPRISVSQDGHAGLGASVIAHVEGSITSVVVDDKGQDYEEIPTVRVTGGNNDTAILKAKMKTDHQLVEFDSTTAGSVVNTITDRFVFTKPHGLKDGEEIIYDANGSSTIGIGVTPGTLIDTAPYFVVKLDDFQIHLSESKTKALAGIGTLPLTSNGGGLQRFKTVRRRQKVDRIEVENSGLFKNREIRTSTVGINTYISKVEIENHGFLENDVIKYSSTGTVNSPIGGLTNNTEYFVRKLDDHSFRLAANKKDTTFINFTNNGLGVHVFQDPPISVEISGRQGISTSNAEATPIIRGSVTAVHVYDKGSDYGSTVINDNYKPVIETTVGKNAFLQPFIVNGRIDQIIIKHGGENFFSTPDIIISGDGVGCKVKANVSGGTITSIDIIEKGAGYSQTSTTARAATPGTDAIFSSVVKKWTVNQVDRFARFGDVSDDDGFYENITDADNGNPYVNYYVPRKLRDYLEDFGQDHSPIIGWAYDGHPIYGPYAVVDGAIKYLESGYTKLASQRVDGPSITKYPAGFFIEDFTYVDGVGDLDEHNGRFAATPEFPNGVYAYYTTVETTPINNPTSPFNGVRRPVFPYIIGDSYHSKPDTFNTSDNSQDIDPATLDLVRNTTPYNIAEYEFVSNSNKNTTLNSKIVKTKTGSVERIDIILTGKDYNVNDKLVFDNKDTGGTGAIGKVKRITGPGITTFTSTVTTYPNTTLLVKNQTVTGITTFPHGIPNKANVEIIGISTDTHRALEARTKIDVPSVRSGIGMTMKTFGLSTSVILNEWLPDVIKSYKFRVNDIVTIGSEQLKIVNFDVKNNRLEMLRAQNGTVAAAHTFGTEINRLEKEFTFQLDDNVDLVTPLDQSYYFNAETAVGTGNTFGVGIGTTVTVAGRGGNQLVSFFNNETKQKFIPTRSIYVPNHPFKTGDKVSYSPGAGTSIKYQTDAMKRVNVTFARPLPPEVYVQKLNNDLIGIVTTQSGIGSDLQRVMFSANAGIGNTHSFTTQKGEITGTVRIINVVATTEVDHTFKKDDEIDMTVVSSATSSVTAVYDPGTRFVSIGSSINPPLPLTDGTTLKVDTSDSSLENTKLNFYLDSKFNKPFVGSGVSVIEVQEQGIPGNSGSFTNIKFSNQVPDVLYYKFLPLQNTKTIEVDTTIKDYSKIFVNNSKFTGKHRITSTTSNTFTFNIFELPEVVGYSSASTIDYTTNSSNITGGIAQVALEAGGLSYTDTPEVSVASTTGSSANLKAFGSNIGAIDKVDIVEFGYDYPSDSTLRPKAAVPQVIFLKDNFGVESVAITSTGRNYLTAPNFVIYNSKTNTVNSEPQFEAQMTGGSVTGVKIVSEGGGLSSGDVELYAIDNSNGVGIVSAIYTSNNQTVTLRLQTPITGFTTAVPIPFTVGDKVFVENVGVSTGNGFNSSDYGFQSFTLTGVTTNFGNVNQATIQYKVTKDPGVHNYLKYGTVSLDRDLAKFRVNLIESTFLNGEPVTSTGGGVAEVVKGVGKTRNVLRVDSLVGFHTGDVISGKFSNASGTIESTQEYTGHFTLDSSIEKPFGWERDTGKLSDFYQRVQDNDYYQNFAYSLKSTVGIASWSEPVDSLTHIAGFKKHSDLLINSVPAGIGSYRFNDNSPPPIGISSGAGGVVLIDAEASIHDKHQFDLVTENTDEFLTVSDEVTFKSGRFGDAIICNTNRVLELDDLSPQFYSDPNLIRSVELDTFDMLTGGPGSDGINAVKYYAQVVLDTALGISVNATQYSEFVVFHDGTDAYLNTYNVLSDGKELGEFVTETSGPLASVLFVPNNSSFAYDITFHKEILTHGVGVGSTSFGFQEYKGKTVALNVFGSAVVQEVDAIDATLYKSGSILVAARSPGFEKEIDEFTWLADGNNKVLFTNFGRMDADTDVGTFQINMLSNVLKLRHTSPVGVAVTVSALSRSVGVAQTHANTGIIGSYIIGDTELDGTFTTIAPISGTPNPQVISNKSYDNYTTCKYHIEIHNTTDDEYSVFNIAANSFGGNANFSKYNNLFTADSEKRNIDNTGIHISGNNTQLRFTPVANKAYTIRVAELKIDKPDAVASDATFNY